MNHPTLPELSAAWLTAKADEDLARAARLEIEAAIVAALPGPDEGTKTEKLPNIKVSVTRKLNRTVDSDALSEDWKELSPAVQSAFKWKADLSLTALRALDFQDLNEASTYITTKPAKPAVKIEPITTND
jgi:hypothetical protein